MGFFNRRWPDEKHQSIARKEHHKEKAHEATLQGKA
jgi:hypothetical protein